MSVPIEGIYAAKEVVDRRAGKNHSDSGVVMSTLKEALEAAAPSIRKKERIRMATVFEGMLKILSGSTDPAVARTAELLLEGFHDQIKELA